MDLTKSPKPRPFSRYVGDKVRDPYYGPPRPGTPPPSPIKRGARSKRKALPPPSPSKPHRRPASKPLGYNPFARYRHDEKADYQVYEPMSDLAARRQPADARRTWNYGDYTVPGIRDEEEEERAKELQERRRLRAEEREFNRRLRAFEKQEKEKSDGKWKGKGKGKGKEVDRDEDGDEAYDVESGLEDVDMLDIV